MTKDNKEATGLAKNFKALRQMMGLTQKDMAQKLDTTQANISQIESGECIPGGGFFMKLANLYPETNFNWLFYHEGSAKKTEEQKRLRALAAQEAEKRLEKKTMKTVAELEAEIKRLRENETMLLSIMNKKVK